MDTLELMELRVKRARIGVVTTAGAFVVGTVLMGVGYAGCPISEPRCEDWAFPMFVTGTTLVVGGIFGLITSGGIMAHRKRKLRKHKRELRESPYTHYGTPRRAQWDLAQSRLVF